MNVRERRLERDITMHIKAIKLRQIAVEQAQALLRIIIAIEENQSICWMIERLMKRLELLISQIGDSLRIASRFVPVRIVRKQG